MYDWNQLNVSTDASKTMITTSEFEVLTVASNEIRWSLGDWFAVVDAERSAEAEECETDDDIKDVLTRDADCGGIFDCSDESVLIKAGLTSAEPDETPVDESFKSMNAAFARNSGVYQ
jgi:hypothetical protein